MAEDYDNVDYEGGWTDSYSKWQRKASDGQDDYQSEVAAFINSGPRSIDEDDVEDEAQDFADGVSGVDEEDWEESAVSTEEWYNDYVDAYEADE